MMSEAQGVGVYMCDMIGKTRITVKRQRALDDDDLALYS